MHEAADQQAAHHVEVVLVEVLVPALGGVEGEEFGFALRGGGRVDLLVGGVFEGVGDLRGFAEGADAHAEVGACDEGADYGEEDEAGGLLV